MKHRLTTAIAAAAMLLFGGLPAFSQGYVTTVPFTETFDDDTHYTEGGTMPDGWAVSATEGDNGFARAERYDNYPYVEPYSGEYYISSTATYNPRADAIFTPMLALAGGEEYTISFYICYFDDSGQSRKPFYQLTAGNGQTVADQTITITEKVEVSNTEWQKVEAKFTPTEDGEYSIALQVTSNISWTGIISVDDFTVDGKGGTTEPPTELWEASIPYAENFDDAEHYDGKGYLPNGWFSSGEDPFVTANSDDVPAVSGLYYMVSPSSILTGRRDIAYSPLLEMEAGQEYRLSFYLNMPGGESTPAFKLTVGQDQAADMQETVLKEVNRVTDGWERIDVTFTPETTAEYSFAFWAVSPEPWAGLVCVDNFRLSKANEIFPPETGFEIGNTLYSVISYQPVLFPNQTVQMVNTTDDANSYTWSVTGGEATISDPTAVNPTITFKETADYTITLTAENEGGTKETSRRFSPTFPEKDATDALQTTTDTDYMYDQTNVPAFLEDGTVVDDYTYSVHQNYVVGVNPYYRAFAERFEIPSDCELTLTAINFYSMEYFLFDQTLGVYDPETGEFLGNSSFDKGKKLKVVIYPEKDGKPDVTNPVYTKEGEISEMILDDYYPVRENVQFDDAEEPVTVKGTFYVALEFDELTLEPYSDQTLSRSYVGLATSVHSNGQTTLWVKPEKAIPGSQFEQSGKLGEYVRADEFSQELAGYSFGVMPWVVYGESCVSTGIGENVVSDNTFKLYASLDGDNFKVVGIQPGDNVQVYSANGVLVFNKKASGSDMFIPASGWTKGIYIISVNGQSVKVVR